MLSAAKHLVQSGLCSPHHQILRCAQDDINQSTAELQTCVLLVGTATWVVAAASLVLVGVMLAWVITSRRRMRREQMVRADQWLQRSMLDGITDPVFIKDRSGRYLLANQAFAKLVGKPPAEIIGHTDDELFGPDAAKRMHAADDRILQSGITQTYEESTAVAGVARHQLTTKGTYQDESGNVSGIFGIMRDLTSWKRMQQERRELIGQLRAERARLEAVLAQMPAGVVLAEAPSGRLILSNERVDIILRRPLQALPNLQAYGETVAFHSDGTPYQAHDWPLARSIRDGEVVESEEAEIERGDGTRGFISLNSAPILDAAGRVVAGVMTFYDITERKQADELYRKQQAELAHLSRVSVAGQMATGLAHELNQPLGAILNYASACSSALDSGRDCNGIISESLQEIAKETRRAGEIIKRLRGFLRRQEPRTVTVDINDVVRESMRLMAWDLRGGGVIARVQLSDDLPPAKADIVQIEQVLVNLVRNAIDAMSAVAPAERQLLVWTAPGERMHGVRVGVTDNGPPLDEQALARMFDAFFTTKPDGLGIGLTISRSIIEAHCGKLWPRLNDGGRGVTMEFTLPASESTPELRSPAARVTESARTRAAAG